MLKRTEFRRKPPAPYVKPERAPRTLTPLERTPRYGSFDKVLAVAKEAPARHEGYRRLVAAMPCCRCGWPQSQAAHADFGKGLGIKSDDRTCMPLCATAPGRAGCHDIVGASGTMPREERRAFEVVKAAETRESIRRAGQWPADLPHMLGEEDFEEAA